MARHWQPVAGLHTVQKGALHGTSIIDAINSQCELHALDLVCVKLRASSGSMQVLWGTGAAIFVASAM
jgi:hypothetical protein